MTIREDFKEFHRLMRLRGVEWSTPEEIQEVNFFVRSKKERRLLKQVGPELATLAYEAVRREAQNMDALAEPLVAHHMLWLPYECFLNLHMRRRNEDYRGATDNYLAENRKTVADLRRHSIRERHTERMAVLSRPNGLKKLAL